ncbi:DDE-type integrase/transposase/recombinase [Streptococcus canis]|nr:DDE-type integrase/transposase/recombinase [Streptococcus canis]
MSNFNDNQLVFRSIDLVFNEDWGTIKQCILQSDQGFQYTNKVCLKQLDQLGVPISQSGKGSCYDNACCENFFSHLKSKSLKLHIPEDKASLITQIDKYIR